MAAAVCSRISTFAPSTSRRDLPRLDVMADGDDHHVFHLELVVAAAADLGARQQRERVQVVERFTAGPDAGAVVQRDPPGESVHDQRARGGDPDATSADDPDPKLAHARPLPVPFIGGSLPTSVRPAVGGRSR